MRLFKPEELNINLDFIKNEDKVFFESPVLKDETLKITYYHNINDLNLIKEVDELIKSTFLKFSLENININSIKYLKCTDYFETIKVEFSDIDEGSISYEENDESYIFTLDDKLLLDSFNANPCLELMRSLCSNFENKVIKTLSREITVNKKEFIDNLKNNADRISENFKIVKEEKKKSEASSDTSGKKSFFKKSKQIDKNKCTKIKDINSDMDFITIQGEVFEYEFVDRQPSRVYVLDEDEGYFLECLLSILENNELNDTEKIRKTRESVLGIQSSFALELYIPFNAIKTYTEYYVTNYKEREEKNDDKL